MDKGGLRIALVWDLGGGRGHAVRVAALAKALRAAGHRVLLFARDLATLAEAVGQDFTLLAAPHNDWLVSQAPASWGEILWSEAGLHDRRNAVAIARAWRDSFRALAIDLVVADAAPLALFAARALSLPAVAIGTGFLVPPAEPPWPSFRPWELSPERARAQAAMEAQVAQRWAELESMLSIPQGPRASRELLFTLPDFDHYPHRGQAHYLGPLLGQGIQPIWPDGPGSKVFVYLQAYSGHIGVLGEVLAELRVPVLVHLGGGQANWPAQPNVHIAERPLAMDAVLAQADLVVSHGGNLAVLAAQAGVPSLLLPFQAEMLHTAQRLAALGLGRWLGPPDGAQIGATLASLLADDATRQRCRAYSRRHPLRGDDQLLAEAVHLIERWAA
jgi:UDP:flavonoid glycosyltransferase YjiC (YdhE family)